MFDIRVINHNYSTFYSLSWRLKGGDEEVWFLNTLLSFAVSSEAGLIKLSETKVILLMVEIESYIFLKRYLLNSADENLSVPMISLLK